MHKTWPAWLIYSTWFDHTHIIFQYFIWRKEGLKLLLSSLSLKHPFKRWSLCLSNPKKLFKITWCSATLSWLQRCLWNKEYVCFPDNLYILKRYLRVWVVNAGSFWLRPFWRDFWALFSVMYLTLFELTRFFYLVHLFFFFTHFTSNSRIFFSNLKRKVFDTISFNEFFLRRQVTFSDSFSVHIFF